MNVVYHLKSSDRLKQEIKYDRIIGFIRILYTVNDAESGASDKAWMVRLWPGSGYYLPAFGAYASSEEDALEKVVAYLDQKGDDSFFCDDYVEEMKEELAQEGKDEEEIWKEIDEQFCYVDATMDGGECHYVFWENLSIYPYDEKRFR